MLPSEPRSALAPTLALVLALALALPASSALAWTEAAVHSVQADIEVGEDATAEVELHARVRVHGGWLEGLELADLDPDLTLLPVGPDPAPRAPREAGSEAEGDEAARALPNAPLSQPELGALASVVHESGERFSPAVSVLRGGRIALRFRRHETPRRGTLNIRVRYRTSLAHRATAPRPGGLVRVRWTLPGWRTGLDGVELRVHAPRGARFAASEGGPQPEMQQRRSEEGGLSLLTWRRAHVPRTLPWTIAFDVPEEAMAPNLRGPRAEASAPPPPPPAPGQRPEDPRGAPLFWWILSIGMAGLAWAKRATLRRAARRGRYELKMLAPMRERWRAPAIWLLALGAGYVGPLWPPFAWALLGLVALLSVPRRSQEQREASPGSFRPASQEWIREAERRARWTHLRPEAWLDLSTWSGGALLLLILSTPLWLPAQLGIHEPAYGRWIAAALLPLPLFCAGGRLARPSDPLASLGDLLAATSRLRVPSSWPFALRPMLYVDLEGEVREARIELSAEGWVEGLLRAAIVQAGQHEVGAERRSLALLVVTRAGSRAESTLEAMAEGLPVLPSEGGRRLARVIPFSPERAEALLGPLVTEGPPPALPPEDATLKEPPPLLAHTAAHAVAVGAGPTPTFATTTF